LIAESIAAKENGECGDYDQQRAEAVSHGLILTRNRSICQRENQYEIELKQRSKIAKIKR
jgi:hypothetical protein